MDNHPATQAEIIPYVLYRDVPAALNWLARVFGFVEEMRTETPRGGVHAQMLFGGRRLMLGGGGDFGPPEGAKPTQGVFVYIDDVAAHHAHALAAGAKIDGPPSDHGYGATYTARDPEGHPWYFTQRSPS